MLGLMQEFVSTGSARSRIPGAELLCALLSKQIMEPRKGKSLGILAGRLPRMEDQMEKDNYGKCHENLDYMPLLCFRLWNFFTLASLWQPRIIWRLCFENTSLEVLPVNRNAMSLLPLNYQPDPCNHLGLNLSPPKS